MANIADVAREAGVSRSTVSSVLTGKKFVRPETRERNQADGYWRGPVWAPATALVVAGLRQSGEGSLAEEICRRFAALCERSGFAENFDALSGEGLRDRAYTWTAAVYLTLTGR